VDSLGEPRRLNRPIGRVARIFGVLAAVAALVFLVPAPPAGASQGLVFASPRPLTVSWKELKTGRRVAVCNGGRTRARKLTTAGTGFNFKLDQEGVASKSVLILRLRPGKIAAGKCRGLLLRAVKRARVDSGTYVGAIAVTASGAGVARLGVTVAGPEALTKPAAVTGAGEMAILHAVNSTPWSAPDLRGDQLLLQPPGPGEEPLTLGRGCERPDSDEGWDPESCPLIGNLYQGTDLVHVFIAGEVIHGDGVERLPVRLSAPAHLVGDFEGNLDPSGSGEVSQMVKTKLTASDSWYSALVAVLIGAAIALGLKLLSGRWRPERLLRERQELILDTYEDSDWPSNPAYERITIDIAGVKAYEASVDDGIRKYFGSVLMADQGSDAYKQIESSIALAEADAKVLAAPDGLEASLDALAAEVSKNRQMVADTYRINRTPELLALAAAPLAAGRLGVGDATERARLAKELTPLLREWRKLAGRVLGYEVWLIALDKRAEQVSPRPFKPEDQTQLTSAAIGLAELREEIFRATKDTDLERLRTSYRIEAVFAKLSYLGGRYEVPEPTAPEPLLLAVAASGLRAPVEEAFPEVTERSPEVTAEEVAWKVRKLEPTPAAAATLPETRRRLLAVDLLVLAVGVVAAIVAALGAVYFGKSFGTFENYLTVIVVGSASQVVVSAVQDGLSIFMHDLSTVADVAPPTAKIAPKPA
jgi:hypothetical protein